MPKKKILWKRFRRAFISLHAQKSKGWHDVRAHAINMSCLAACLGLSQYNTKEDELDFADETRDRQAEFTEWNLDNMRHGVIHEDDARKWYEGVTGDKVDELGSAVREDFKWMRGSVDGRVRGKNRNVEIKCPKKMYKEILSFCQNIELIRGQVEKNKFYKNHIKIEHYCQMLGCMWITETPECDYIVYSTENLLGFIYRVFWNQEFWNTYIMPGVILFVIALEPRLNSKGLKLDTSYEDSELVDWEDPENPISKYQFESLEEKIEV